MAEESEVIDLTLEVKEIASVVILSDDDSLSCSSSTATYVCLDHVHVPVYMPVCCYFVCCTRVHIVSLLKPRVLCFYWM